MPQTECGLPLEAERATVRGTPSIRGIQFTCYSLVPMSRTKCFRSDNIHFGKRLV